MHSSSTNPKSVARSPQPIASVFGLRGQLILNVTWFPHGFGLLVSTRLLHTSHYVFDALCWLHTDG